jgi:hypothetical protein
MATVRRVRFLADCYDRGERKYSRGLHHPPCPTTLLQVQIGAAELVMQDMDEAQHADETAAALQAWNVTNARTVAADPSLWSAENPAAVLVAQRLREARSVKLFRVQRARFLQDHYYRGTVRYAEGQDYPVSHDVRSQVVGGHAELVRIRVGLVGFGLHIAQQYRADRRYARENSASLIANREALR